MGADSSTSARIVALGGAISVSSGDASEVSSCWRPPELFPALLACRLLAVIERALA
jgi:hypothetical protein